MKLSHEIKEAIKAYWGSNHQVVLKRIEACLRCSRHSEWFKCGINLQELHCSDHAALNDLQDEIKDIIKYISNFAD